MFTVVTVMNQEKVEKVISPSKYKQKACRKQQSSTGIYTTKKTTDPHLMQFQKNKACDNP